MSAIALTVSVLVVSLGGSTVAGGEDPPPHELPAVVYVELLHQGRGVHWWARRAVQARKDANARGRTIRRLRRTLRQRWEPRYEHLIALAAAAYGVDRATLERKARCESVNFTDFYNESSGASNVFQFLPSTWRTTPFARFSIFDPVAAALAGAWMHDVGRGGEWVCR